MIKIYVQFVKIRVENNNRWTVTDDSNHSANNIKHIIILKFLFVGWVELKTLTLTNNMILCSIICLFLFLFFYALAFFIKRPRFPKWQKFLFFLFFLSNEAIFLFFFIFHHSPLRIIYYMRNCYYRTPNVNVCTNAWQQEEKKPLRRW